MYKYKAIKINGKKIDEHRYIMEQHIGRKLSRNELVIHLDGNPKNNDITNLKIIDRGSYVGLLSTGRKASLTTREKLSESHKGVRHVALEKPVGQYTKDGKLVKIFPSISAASVDGFRPEHISSVCNGKRKTTGGFIWKLQ